MAGVLAAVPYVGWTVARNRRVDLVALFTLANAVAHVVLLYTLPIDLISLATTLEWFGSLACLITWHVWYIRREHLDA